MAITMADYEKSHKEFMELLSKKDYDNLPEDELDEDIIISAFVSAIEANEENSKKKN